jgi:hypothetical protein
MAMIKTAHVYPVPGRIVRHPETGQVVPAEGLDVPRSGYWLRRLQDGDLTEMPPGASGKKKSPSAGVGLAQASAVTAADADSHHKE